MDPVSLRKSLASALQRFPQHVYTIVVLRLYRASRTEQKTAGITAKIQHRLILPLRITELFVKIRKVARVAEVLALRSLLSRTSPKVYLFHLTLPSRVA